jgi:hypothetical protein
LKVSFFSVFSFSFSFSSVFKSSFFSVWPFCFTPFSWCSSGFSSSVTSGSFFFSCCKSKGTLWGASSSSLLSGFPLLEDNLSLKLSLIVLILGAFWETLFVSFLIWVSFCTVCSSSDSSLYFFKFYFTSSFSRTSLFFPNSLFPSLLLMNKKNKLNL